MFVFMKDRTCEFYKWTQDVDNYDFNFCLL